MRFPAELVEHRRVGQSQRATVGMRQLLRQGEGLVHSPERLLCVAKMPERVRQKAAGEHSQVGWEPGRALKILMPPRVIARDSPIQLHACHGEFPLKERALSHSEVSPDE